MSNWSEIDNNNRVIVGHQNVKALVSSFSLCNIVRLVCADEIFKKVNGRIDLKKIERHYGIRYLGRGKYDSVSSE